MLVVLVVLVLPTHTVVVTVVCQRLSCECEHNTCGESCDRCCPGYNQKPWMAGTFLTRHVCESKRTFERTLYTTRTISVTIHSA